MDKRLHSSLHASQMQQHSALDGHQASQSECQPSCALASSSMASPSASKVFVRRCIQAGTGCGTKEESASLACSAVDVDFAALRCLISHNLHGCWQLYSQVKWIKVSDAVSYVLDITTVPAPSFYRRHIEVKPGHITVLQGSLTAVSEQSQMLAASEIAPGAASC